MSKILMICVAAVMMSACTATVKPQKTTVDFPNGVRVQTEGGNGNFCPPGQAKKGNC